jgi:hypothetical protein
MAQNNDRWCFSWFAKAPSSPGTDRGALQKNAKWNSGEIITVSFLDGIPSVQDRVKKAALKWTVPGLANLNLNFRTDTTNTLIRISFKYAGSWSTVGTTCKQVTDKTQPTMNFGWLDENSTDTEVESVVLHEFGHALGLIHEHQNPSGGIKWNRQNVIKALSGPPNNWDLEKIEFNMFRTFDKAETNFTKTDPASIMMYPIPKTWTEDGFSVGENTQLSDTDKKFIRQQYP